MAVKQITGYPNYSISDEGVVFSRHRKCSKGGALCPTFDRRYCYVNLHKNGKQRVHTVHKLILEAFVGLRPKGMECRHLDGNPKNNNLSNLCWGTSKENAMDKIKHGTTCSGERIGNAKLTAGNIKVIRRLHEFKQWQRQKLARLFRVSARTIDDVLQRRTWRHVIP